MAYGTVNADKMTTSDGYTSAGTYGFKNRIINGAMVIAQRATSSSPTGGGYFTVDRWRLGQNSGYASSLTPTISQSSTAPTGFINSFLYTNGTGSAPTSAQLISIDQYIEGLNCTDLAFGSASVATITISFWVRASITGTYAVALTNSAIDRSYVTTYTILSANTWEQKSVTIAGDQSGTWLTTNGTGILVRFPLGAGSTFQTTAGAWQAGNYYTTSACTNLTATTGATFYITGVQLEKGSTATSFDYRPYGLEFKLAQRYFQTLPFGSGFFSMGGAIATNNVRGTLLKLDTVMRAAPTVTIPASGSGAGQMFYSTASGGTPTTIGTNSVQRAQVNSFQIEGDGYTGAFVVGQAVGLSAGSGGLTITASSEL
jgi:hypothetical protein